MMTMLMPTRRNFFNNLMADPFDAFFDTPFAPTTKSSSSLMRTDIKEHEGGFEMTIDLPGFKKEDVEAELKDALGGSGIISSDNKSCTYSRVQTGCSC